MKLTQGLKKTSLLSLCKI